MQNFAHTTLHGAIDGKTQTKELTYYNLDVIISVGYRVKSQRGVQALRLSETPYANTILPYVDATQLLDAINPQVNKSINPSYVHVRDFC